MTDEGRESPALQYASRRNEPPPPEVSWRGIAVVFGVLLLVGLAVVVPSVYRYKVGANHVRCCAHLHRIGFALQAYARDNGGWFPETLDPLIASGAISLEDLTCPSARSPLPGTRSSYVYLAGQREDDGFDNVLVYEPLGYHADGKGTVAYLNGSARILSARDHAAALARTRANLAAKAATQSMTQPASP